MTDVITAVSQLKDIEIARQEVEKFRYMREYASLALDVAKLKLVFAQHASRTGEILPPLGAEAAERFFKERA